LSPHPSQGGESQGDPAPHSGTPATIGVILLVLDQSMDISAVTLAFRARGLRPVSMPAVQDAMDMVSRWQPQAVILQAGPPDSLALLVLLKDRGIPCVLIGTSAQLHDARGQYPGCAHLLLPVEAEEITEAALLVIGPGLADTLPDRIDLGILKIDLRTRRVEVESRREVLPPKEFEILVQLALQPGVPLASTELLRRVWPESPSATVNELHARIWRLRRMLGDHRRPQPLIVNRRGFGYLLNIAGSPSG